jgi:polyphosphate kinase
VNEVFHQLTGLGKASKLKFVWQAPFTLHSKVIEAIDNEAKHAKAGKPARIMAKMNSLLEPQTIEALYRASQAGVKIDLIVRGLCALRPGVKGLSDNIKVRSIIRTLPRAHARLRLSATSPCRVWLSSADWMDRNFFRRIELCFRSSTRSFPTASCAKGIQPYLDDNGQAWLMHEDGASRSGSAATARAAARRSSC